MRTGLATNGCDLAQTRPSIRSSLISTSPFAHFLDPSFCRNLLSLDPEAEQPNPRQRRRQSRTAVPPRGRSFKAGYESARHTICSLFLRIAPRIVGRAGADSLVRIRLNNQAHKKFLVDICNKREMGPGDKYQMPREWSLECNRYGRWYLNVQHQIASNETFA